MDSLAEWAAKLIAIAEPYSGLITALATLAIAIFTGTLYWTTRKLWRSGERSTKAVEASTAQAKEAMALESRPWLGVDVEFTGLRFVKKGVYPVYSVHIQNFGRSPARFLFAITTHGVEVPQSDLMQATEAALEKADLARSPLIFPGQRIKPTSFVLVQNSGPAGALAKEGDQILLTGQVALRVKYSAVQGGPVQFTAERHLWQAIVPTDWDFAQVWKGEIQQTIFTSDAA